MDMIRLATADDADELAELERVLFPENCFNEYTLKKELDVSECWVLGAPIFAYALLRVDPYLSDLLRLGVLEEYQGRGYGRRLMGHCLDRVDDLLLTVNKRNHKAIKLYLSCGFELVGSTENNWFLLRKIVPR